MIRTIFLPSRSFQIKQRPLYKLHLEQILSFMLKNLREFRKCAQKQGVKTHEITNLFVLGKKGFDKSAVFGYNIGSILAALRTALSAARKFNDPVLCRSAARAAQIAESGMLRLKGAILCLK